MQRVQKELCECGCGRPLRIRKNYVARFLHGHNKQNLTDEYKKKISDTLKGHKLSDETKQKISKTLRSSGKLSKALKGQKRSETQKQKIRMSLKQLWKNEEYRNMMIRVRKNRVHDPCSKETKQKISNTHKTPRISKIHSDTSIKNLLRKKYKFSKDECKMIEILKKNNIEFIHQYVVKIPHKYVADFYLPTHNLIIECDGIYWHNYPFGTERDKIRNLEMIKNNFKVLRFWEGQVNEEKVLNEINVRIQ